MRGRRRPWLLGAPCWPPAPRSRCPWRGSAGSGGIATTVTLTSSENPTAYGDQLILTATVIPASGTAMPSGSVTFEDAEDQPWDGRGRGDRPGGAGGCGARGRDPRARGHSTRDRPPSRASVVERAGAGRDRPGLDDVAAADGRPGDLRADPPLRGVGRARGGRRRAHRHGHRCWTAAPPWDARPWPVARRRWWSPRSTWGATRSPPTYAGDGNFSRLDEQCGGRADRRRLDVHHARRSPPPPPRPGRQVTLTAAVTSPAACRAAR